jgi:outer membrane protein insertion porin family
MDTKWNLGGDIYRSQRIYSDYTRRLTGADIKGGYPINDFIGTFLMYKYEVKDLYNPQQAYQVFNNADPDSFPLGVTTTSSIMASFTHNNTDYRLDPSTGFIDTVSAEFAGVGGNNKFARYIMDNTWFYPLAKKLTFSTKLVFGYISEVEGQLVPIDEKFYLGGIYSLIGYKARTVSPVNHLGLANVINGAPSDQVVYLGGNKEVFGNAEISYPLIADVGIKGILFFDYGNSTSDSYAKMFGSLLMSFGGGISWASPLGPLRMEYGVPVNPRPGLDNPGGRFEFAIGSLF